MYNQFVQGNAELLSISSNDSIWNSDEDDDRNSVKRKPSRIPGSILTEDFLGGDLKDGEENAESVQYKKTMLQRYLNDAIEVSRDKRNQDNTSENSLDSQVLFFIKAKIDLLKYTG